MTKTSKSVVGRLDLSGSLKLRKAMKRGWCARVGILGDNDAREENAEWGNAEIGLMQEFGSLTGEPIPPRSWLRMPLNKKSDRIYKYLQSSQALALIEGGKFRKLFTNIGIIGEAIVQEAFETSGFGDWKPNSPITIAGKGSDKPLIDTSQLRTAVTSQAVLEK